MVWKEHDHWICKKVGSRVRAVAYRARMSEYHPDKVASLGPDIRALAEQKAKEINAAYAEATAGH